jgi:hypothetical protein
MSDDEREAVVRQFALSNDDWGSPDDPRRVLVANLPLSRILELHGVTATQLCNSARRLARGAR